MSCMRKFLLRCSVAAMLLAASLSAEEAVEKQPPRVSMCVPLGVPTAGATKVVMRGWHLQSATEVRVADERVQVKLLSNAAAAVPGGQEASQVGDTQLELEITVAGEMPVGTVSLTVVTPDAESSAHELAVGAVEPVLAETEPNDGFSQAQVVTVPQLIEGQIHADKNVDVFAVQLDQPTRLHVEAIARRYGSGLDGLLSVFDEQGHCLAANDDRDDTTDAVLSIQLPMGKYFICLQDASDHGGPAHPYRLIIHGD